ncbi:M20 family metallopeptidase [Sporosalibacterium faouarense]|uniref:M20 family metallopeptidase n=1 Tax=Sporosalibacterium faouarense TaxID=516123 RepID=UPI00192BCBAD|nr:M20 family metallopeptidase [Sporosalibacterium faouarense]
MSLLLDEKLNEQLQKNHEPLIDAIKKVVRIPSIIDEDSKEFAFGEDIDKALKETLNICESLGFKTYCDPEGYYGYAEIGEGEELVGVLGHLDVVPVGSLEEWANDPFDPVIKDGKLYGRGTQDDKGPTLASLYAAKSLMDMGIEFNKRLRFIFGTDEENLWRGIAKYVEKEEKPSMGFTPDSRFPLIYAEKGLLQLHLEGENETSLNLKGGDAFNSVPAGIVYKDKEQEKLKSKLKELGFEYKEVDGGIQVIGKAVHAQEAENGINAISRLAIALKGIGTDSKAIDFIAEEIKEDAFATNIFGNCEDEDSGKLKFNIGKINIGEKEQISIDIRIPVTADKEEVVAKLSKKAKLYGLEYKEYDWLKSIYIPKDHFLIKTLLDVYQDVTGDTESEPISSGGATYARAIDNCVAFGAVLPGREKVEHKPNEYINLEDLAVAMEIYAKAIYKITR